MKVRKREDFYLRSFALFIGIRGSAECQPYNDWVVGRMATLLFNGPGFVF